MLVLVVLALMALIVGAVFYWRTHQPAQGDGRLIAASGEPYKVKPDNPGGMKVEGEGDAAIETGNGAGPGNAAIDLKAMPEAPMPAKHGAPKATATPKAMSSKVAGHMPASGGMLKPVAPGAHGGAGGGGGQGSLVQLGAYPDEGGANAAWTVLSKRFDYLAPLGKSVQKADVGGRTVYRLRVNAGSIGAAQTLCGKLRVAGEACFVTS